MTDKDSTEQGPSTPATWTATPRDVERIVGAVLPHTGSDGHLPMLTCVRVEVEADRFLAVATDRYTLGVAWSKLTDWQEDAPTDQRSAACIYAGDLRRLFSFLRPHKKTAAVWTLTDKSLTAAIGEESLSVRTVDVDFIQWRPILGKLADKAAAPTAAPVMRFTPFNVNKFTQSAKALGEDMGQMYWHHGSGAADPPIVRIGENFVGLLMPQRLPDEVPQLDLSAIGIESVKAVAA